MPDDAVIVIEDDYVTDPADYDYEPVEEQRDKLDDSLELKLQQALALAEQERKKDELEKPKEKEVKKSLLEKNRTKEIMRMLEYDSDEEDEEEDYEERRYPEPRERLYEETIILREILTRNRCNKQFIEFAIEESEEKEGLNEYDIRQLFDNFESGLPKTNQKKKVNLIIAQYQRELERLDDGDEDYPYRPTRRGRSSHRDEPEQNNVGLVLQELQFERALNNLQRELDKRDNKIDRLEEKNQDLTRELMQAQGDIRQLEQLNAQLQVQLTATSTDVKVKDMEMKYAKNYSDDSMKLTSELLDKVTDVVKETRPLAQLGNLTGRRMPTDSRIDNVAKDQEGKSREFEQLMKGRTTETSKVLLGEQQQISINDLIVDDEEYVQ